MNNINDISCHKYGPVSYTHLDVYKRQGKRCTIINEKKTMNVSYNSLNVFDNVKTLRGNISKCLFLQTCPFSG